MNNLDVTPAIIEEDYFVILLLKRIVEKSPEIIFKGGTSLSKCFKIINRFSDDIDIGLNDAQKILFKEQTIKEDEMLKLFK